MKITCAILAILGLSMSIEGRAFAQKAEVTHESRRPTIRPRGAPGDEPVQADDSSATMGYNPRAEAGGTADAADLAELREQIRNLRAEVDQLRSRRNGSAAAGQAATSRHSTVDRERGAHRSAQSADGPVTGLAKPTVPPFPRAASASGETFAPVVETEGDLFDFDVDGSENEPMTAGSGRFQLDDDLSPFDGSAGGIRLIQEEDRSPAEFGAAPGQHLGPRRRDELGSIGMPPMPEYKPNMPARKRKIEAEFAEGLTVKTDDDYFSLTFHNLTQADFRGFVPSGDPLHDNFIIPRQRWYAIGNISPSVRYYTVINRGYGTLDVLDSWVDMNFGGVDREKLQVRVGRMKTPYTYEYIKISETDLIAPERSVFVGNLAPNRQIGIMAHGKVLKDTVEYALGVFNGPRRSFEDFNDGKDLFTFVNTKPFLDVDVDFLKQLNIGGSWNWGNSHNPAQPFALRTANDQSTSSAAGNVSPTFFQFGNNVFEDGTRMQWSGDIAYYYKSLGILAGYQGGFQEYAITTGSLPTVQQLRLGQQEFAGVIGGNRTRVPMTGYSIAAFYFLTGEEITRRVDLLEPRNEYASSAWREGRIGAIELFSRFAYISLGSEVFSAGLADPTLWSNRATVLDNGVNWYLNHYVKLTFDWQYSAYGNPVLLTPAGRLTSFNNLFWVRTQVFF